MQMRHTFVGMGLMAALMGGGLLAAQADPARAARAALQAIYQKQDAAYSRLDPDAALIDYAPDYVDIDANGTRAGLAETRRAQREAFADMTAFHAQTTIQSMTVVGDVATVHVMDNDVATETDASSPQPLHWTIYLTGVDTWKKTAQGWRLTRSQLVSQGGRVTEKRTPSHGGV